jgi:hypothetical protein
MAQSFLLGENFVNKIRSTIDRVDGTPLPGAGGAKRPAILEDNVPGGKAQGHRLVITLKKRNPSTFMMPGHSVDFFMPNDGSSEPPSTAWTSTLPTSEEGLNSLGSLWPAIESASNGGHKTAVLKDSDENPVEKILPFYCDLSGVEDAGLSNYGADLVHISIPFGFVAQTSPSGTETVKVCISGVTYAVVRLFPSFQIVNGKVSRYYSVGRPRRIHLAGQSVGVCDLVRGGSVQLASDITINASGDDPVFAWVPVIL